MTRIVIVACVLLALAGAALAEETVAKERNWGFGWDDGLTLRRNIGLWQVGVSAGPNDSLSDSYQHRFDSDLPDSLQGGESEERHERRESGFVRLHVARQLGAYRTLKFLRIVIGDIFLV